MSIERSPFKEEQTDVQVDSMGRALRVLRRHPRLTWQDASGAHAKVLEARCVLGSAANVDIVVADPAVSRLHAEIDPRDDGVWVRDLDSRNGTFIEHVLVHEARLPVGAAIRLGSTHLTVHYDDKPTPVELWPLDELGPLFGRSVVMRELFARLARVAVTDSTVLVQGETGTGKELVAQALHQASPRSSEPFVIVDCAALPENLLEAELFGHARGAFTGAVGSRAGALESAGSGTVFLDEIGELPLSVQPKLLRAIESRAVRRIGESGYRAVDVRFICATHRDLRTMVNAGAFREDLYFRLAVVPVDVPPLRDRLEDIPLLVQRFLPQGAPNVMTPELGRELASRPWLGNVRELRNFVERAQALGPTEALALTTNGQSVPARPDAFPAVTVDVPFKVLRDRWLCHLEREYLRALLAKHGGNVSATAAAAGLDRAYVHRLMRKHDL